MGVSREEEHSMRRLSSPRNVQRPGHLCNLSQAM
eukprot:gene52347-40624_t